MTILVTGSAGMIGSNLCQELLKNGYNVIGIDKKPITFEGQYEHFEIDLGNADDLEKVFREKKIDRVIHLAALAHTMGGKKYPKKMYEYFNIECANNIFKVSANNSVPVLFISTVDVFGFQKGIVNSETVCKPVTVYGKTKLKAEELLKNSGAKYSIFRFSPVYTKEIKRDIQKRYYLKFPNWAYVVGKGTDYEVLSIDLAINSIIRWCRETPNNGIRIIKDLEPLNTRQAIAKEKEIGMAKHVIRFPRWVIVVGYYILRLSGKNKITFLINKVLYPLRSGLNGNT